MILIQPRHTIINPEFPSPLCPMRPSKLAIQRVIVHKSRISSGGPAFIFSLCFLGKSVFHSESVIAHSPLAWGISLWSQVGHMSLQAMITYKATNFISLAASSSRHFSTLRPVLRDLKYNSIVHLNVFINIGFTISTTSPLVPDGRRDFISSRHSIHL